MASPITGPTRGPNQEKDFVFGARHLASLRLRQSVRPIDDFEASAGEDREDGPGFCPTVTAERQPRRLKNLDHTGKIELHPFPCRP